ncbi:glycosyltransferase [Cryobacterium sp. W22_MBD10_FK3]|uniref:glycosyltransferase n=1 Tax=Cryobacterium sp. W22_MBD10_FK3 TaxID=3240273 RepID=UPI003F921903
MRVLHVVNDAHTGGAQTLIEGLARAMAPEVESHILVLLGPGVLSGRFSAVASSVTYLNLDRRSWRIDKLVSQTKATIRRVAPDVVHSHLLQSDLSVSLTKKSGNVRFVSTVHTTGMSKADPWRSRVLGQVIGRLTSRRMDAIVACGVGAASYMSRNGYKSGKCHVISNGVAVERSVDTPGQDRRAVFLSLSRWHPMKDHENLLRAFAIMRQRAPEATLVCAGSGIEYSNAQLMAAIEALGLRDSVRLVGPVNNVGDLIKAADALVISSSYGEALPMAGLESLALGTPVITTDVGDCKRLAMAPQYCVEPSDSAALAQAMLMLLSQSAIEYASLREASHDRALAEFSIAQASNAYRALYRSDPVLSAG